MSYFWTRQLWYTISIKMKLQNRNWAWQVRKNFLPIIQVAFTKNNNPYTLWLFRFFKLFRWSCTANILANLRIRTVAVIVTSIERASSSCSCRCRCSCSSSRCRFSTRTRTITFDFLDVSKQFSTQCKYTFKNLLFYHIGIKHKLLCKFFHRGHKVNPRTRFYFAQEFLKDKYCNNT